MQSVLEFARKYPVPTIYIGLFVLSVVLAASPLLIYYHQLAAGILPDPNEWYAVNNHGPWRYEAEGLLIFMPQFLLILLSIGALVFRRSDEKTTAWHGLMCVGLVLLQIGVYILHFLTMGWLWD